MLTSAHTPQLSTVNDIASVLHLTREELERGEREARFNYIQHPHVDRKTGKVRDLCYPPRDSFLRRVQDSIKRYVLLTVPLSPEVRGYLPGSHNIQVAGEICGALYEGRVDISKFHPSITDGHVAVALRKHGLTWACARRLARLVTFRGYLPQGAPTSSHVANLILDDILRRRILPTARSTGVTVRNYGDDIAFSGRDRSAVERCVRDAKRAIRLVGFKTNDKCVECEHRGGKRVFIGCATGRDKPDYPRGKYRDLRKDLRSVLHRLRCTSDPGQALSDRQIRSYKQRIAYVARLNKRKARRLRDIFYRICTQVRRLRLLPAWSTTRVRRSA